MAAKSTASVELWRAVVGAQKTGAVKKHGRTSGRSQRLVHGTQNTLPVFHLEHRPAPTRQADEHHRGLWHHRPEQESPSGSASSFSKPLELQRGPPPQGPGTPPHEVRNASNPQSFRSCFICRVRHHCSRIHLTRQVSIHRTHVNPLLP